MVGRWTATKERSQSGGAGKTFRVWTAAAFSVLLLLISVSPKNTAVFTVPPKATLLRSSKLPIHAAPSARKDLPFPSLFFPSKTQVPPSVSQLWYLPSLQCTSHTCLLAPPAACCLQQHADVLFAHQSFPPDSNLLESRERSLLISVH